jgi:hypothetical protein
MVRGCDDSKGFCGSLPDEFEERFLYGDEPLGFVALWLVSSGRVTAAEDWEHECHDSGDSALDYIREW